MKLKDEPAFINRNKDMSFLKEWISRRPGQILFLFGPKSSGKTTLLYRFFNNSIEMQHYEVKFINLRKILIANYKDFLRIFFGHDESKEKSDLKETKEYNLKIFKLKVEALKGLKQKKLDPFAIMEKELEKIVQKGRIPIIVVDELQALENIYMNGQKELLKELFNFFVSITKESHLAHVIISSSDGFFIERIYSDSRLSKTSQFREIDYLPKADIEYWLNNLKKESNLDLILTKEQIECIWNYFGGSVWEVRHFLTLLDIISENNHVKTQDIENEALKEIKAAKVRFTEYPSLYFHDDLFLIIEETLKSKDYIVLEDFTKKFDRKKVHEELGNLVSHNIFSYNPTTGEYKPQGHSMRLGLSWYCKDCV